MSASSPASISTHRWFAAAATGGGIIGQQVAGKAVRDALFLSVFHVRNLPLIMAAGALLSLLVVLWVSRVLATVGPRRVLTVLFVAGSVSLFLEWALSLVSAGASAVAVYLHIAVLSPVALSTFWSLINEQFDPHAAKTAVSRIAAGGAVGGVLGGIAAWRAAYLMHVPGAILLLAATNLFCLGGVLSIPHAPHTAATADAPSETAEVSPLKTLWGASYLRNLALLVALGAAMSSLLDYVFSAQVTARYGDGQALLSFFGLFGVVVSVLSLLLQATVGRISMEKLGIAVNIAVLPGIIVLGGALGLAVPGLRSATLLRGAEMVQRNTLFRSAYELLYTPLREREKRSTKILIDVGFDRFGTVAGSGIILVALMLFPNGQTALLALVVILAVTTLPLARQLRSGYVAALERGLREGNELLPVVADDAVRPTREPDEPARDKLIQQIETLRKHEDTDGPMARLLADPHALRERADALLSSDPQRIQSALGGWTRDVAPLSGLGIALLAHSQVHKEARDALRTVAHESTGQLFDALLDPATDFIVRRRIPAVLAVCATQRAANGLLMGLSDPRFEVRHACGRALAHVIARGGGRVSVPQETIVSLIVRECAQVSAEFVEANDEPEDEPEVLPVVLARERVSRTVEHLFTLLSFVVDREPLMLCFRALHQSDSRARGTALEYLQSVLPAEVRDVVLPLLGIEMPIPAPRLASEVLRDLSQALDPGTSAAPSGE